MRRDTGSVLVLVPAGVLVLMILGAVSVDAAAVFLGQRQLVRAAEAAATDAAGSISQQAFYTAGVVALDPVVATRVADESVADQDLSGVALSAPPAVQVEGRQVCVSLAGRVGRVFGLAIPGIARTVAVTGRATATAAGDTGTDVPRRRIC